VDGDSAWATTILLDSTFGLIFNCAFETVFAAGFDFSPKDLAPLECLLGDFFDALFLGFAFVAMIRAPTVETAALIKVVVFKVKRPTPPMEEHLLC